MTLLNISGAEMEPMECERLSNFTCLTNLEELYLEDCTDVDASDLASLITSHGSLKKISLIGASWYEREESEIYELETSM